ncbi:MAG: Txe/YoeB family addiction module toxin [Lachnospiraceae bacterium]|nr:Txe/YoeB family addiction module toxin [Lachnospiraceae bacterium]MCI1726273.1 Txe/YoeB family addiction module toxin [Lachnospiraceae bacterium]
MRDTARAEDCHLHFHCPVLLSVIGTLNPFHYIIILSSQSFSVACSPCPIGKPEALKFALSGCFSRRIDAKNRLVYQTDGSSVIILSCRYHYG